MKTILFMTLFCVAACGIRAEDEPKPGTDEYNKAQRAKGLVLWKGEWMLPEEREAKRRGVEAAKAPPKKSKPAELRYPFQVGDTGVFNSHYAATFAQIIDENTARVHIRFVPDVDTMVVNGVARKVVGNEFDVWMTGLSTEGKIDGSALELKGIQFKVTNTKQYQTVDGGTKTIFELSPAD